MTNFTTDHEGFASYHLSTEDASDHTPASCECDNTHKANDTVCRWCWAHGRRHWNDPDVLTTPRYTRSQGVGITILGGYECHDIFAPDGTRICTVMAPGLVDLKAPKPVTAQADALLAHLNRD